MSRIIHHKAILCHVIFHSNGQSLNFFSVSVKKQADYAGIAVKIPLKGKLQPMQAGVFRTAAAVELVTGGKGAGPAFISQGSQRSLVGRSCIAFKKRGGGSGYAFPGRGGAFAGGLCAGAGGHMLAVGR